MGFWRRRFVNGVIFFCFVLSLACTNNEHQIKKHWENAEKYIAKKMYKDAIIELKNIIQRDPSNDKAYFQLGQIYLKLKDEKEAQQYFIAALQNNPLNINAGVLLGQKYLIEDRVSDARKVMMPLVKAYPSNREVLHLKASVLVFEKNYTMAIQALEKAQTIDADNYKTYLLLGQVYAKVGNIKKMEQAYRKAIAIDPTLPMPYIGLASLYGTQNKWNQVESILNQMISQPGDESEKYKEIAAFYEKMNRLKEAKNAFETAVSALNDKDITSYMNLGLFYIRRQDYPNALETMQKALSLSPGNVAIMEKIAEVYFDLNQLDNAESMVDRILMKDQKNEEANFIKGRLLLLQKHYDTAIHHFITVIRQNSDNAMAYYYKALCHLGGGGRNLPGQELFKTAAGLADDSEIWDRTQAIESLKSVVDLIPNFFPGRILLAELYIAEKRITESKVQVEYLMQRIPNYPRALILQGRIKFLEKDRLQAEAIFKRVTELAPQEVQGYLYLGMMYAYENKKKEAIESLEKALLIDPDNTRAIEILILLYKSSNDFEAAFQLCRTHIQKANIKQNTIAQINYFEGLLYWQKGKKEPAIQKFMAAKKANPGLIDAYDSLGQIYFSEGRRDNALKEYEKIIQKRPGLLRAYINMAKIAEYKKDWSSAERYYRRAIEIKRNYTPALNNLAFLLVETGGDLNEAVRFAEYAKYQEPRNPLVLDTLGWIYYKQGRYNAAVIELKECVRIKPDDPLVHFHLGWAYYELKNFEKAREHMREALRIDPRFKGAESAYSLLGITKD